MMINNNNHSFSYSYSVGSSSSSGGLGGGGGSSSEVDSIFFFAEEEMNMSGRGGGECWENDNNNSFNNFEMPIAYSNNKSNTAHNTSIDTTHDIMRFDRQNYVSSFGNDTGSMTTVRGSNQNMVREEKGTDPCEENDIRHHHNSNYNRNYTSSTKSSGIRNRINHASKKDPPSAASSAGMGVGVASIANYHTNKNNSVKKRQSFDMWVIRQQQQQQKQQRDGNMSILTDEMSEVQLQYHLSQKRQQKQQQQIKLHPHQEEVEQQQQQQLPLQEQVQQRSTGNNMSSTQHASQPPLHLHPHDSTERWQDHPQRPLPPPPRSQLQQHQRSRQPTTTWHPLQVVSSAIATTSASSSTSTAAATTTSMQQQKVEVEKEEEEIEKEEENEGGHWQQPMNRHHQYHQHPSHNHHRRRRRQQQWSQYSSEVGGGAREEVADEADNDEEGVQHQQQHQKQQSHQLHHPHRRRRQEPPSSLQQEKLKNNDDHRLQLQHLPQIQQVQQSMLSSAKHGHLPPLASGISRRQKQTMQQPLWSRGELGGMMMEEGAVEENDEEDKEVEIIEIEEVATENQEHGPLDKNANHATHHRHLSRVAPTASIDTSFSNEDGTSDVSGTVPRKVSFDESEVESSMSPPGKERNLEEKLSSLLQRQQRRSQLQCKASAIDKDGDDDDMMMIQQSCTFESMKSSALASIAASSVQFSVESECVRQNVQIAEMMEGAMMDFFVLEQAAESNEDTTLADPDNEEMQARTKAGLTTSSPALFVVGDDGIVNLAEVEVHDPKHHCVGPSPLTKPANREADRVPASPPKLTQLEALPSITNDNKDLAKFLFQFSDHILNGCNNYDTDSSDVFFISNSQFGKEEDTSRIEDNPSEDQRDNNSMDSSAHPHLLTRTAAFGRVVSSISVESDEEDQINPLQSFEKSRLLPNLPPASTFLSAKERARIRQHDTTPVRTNTSHARYRKYMHMHSDGDMASIKEEMVEEEEEEEESDDVVQDTALKSAKINDEEVMILEKERDPDHSKDSAQHNISAGALPSDSFDHHRAQRSVKGDFDMLDRPSAFGDDCCNASEVVEFDANKVLPSKFDSHESNHDADLYPKHQPDHRVTHENKPVDPPSDVSFDVDHSEEFAVNNQSLSSDAITDVNKMTYREMQKGRSLAWHSTNGVNDDELYDTNQSPAKAIGGASIAGRLNSIAIASHTSLFRLHAADDNGMNAVVNRRHLGLIEETSLEGSERSDNEHSTSEGESESYSRDGIGTDQGHILSNPQGGVEISAKAIVSSSSSSGASASSASGSGTPVQTPRFTVKNRVDYQPPVTTMRTNYSLHKSGAHDAKKKLTTKDLPPIIRFEMQHGPMQPTGGRRRSLAKPTNLGGNGISVRRSQTIKSQFSHAPSSRHHPHHVPHELPRSRLEEKLRGNSIRDSLVVGDFGNNSVGTSELGSLFTRESDRSHINLPVPSVIFHRTYPRLDLSASDTNNEMEFTGVAPTSKSVSLSEGSESSSCTPDSGCQIMNDQQKKEKHQSVDHARGRVVADPARQIIDIGDIIHNFKSVGSTIAKLGEDLFEKGPADVASSTQPNGLGEAPDYEHPSASNQTELERTVSASSDGAAMIHNKSYNDHQSERQVESIVVDSNTRDDIGNLSKDAYTTSANEQRRTDIGFLQHIAFMEQRNANSGNNDTPNKQQVDSIWQKLEEQKVKSFWSQLELDDEMSASQLQPQQQQVMQVKNSRPKPIAAALNKNVGRRAADDASASHHSSIFEAFEVAPLRFVGHIVDSAKPASDERVFLNNFGVQHSCVRPGSQLNDVGFPGTSVNRVIYASSSERTPTASTDMLKRSQHSTSVVNTGKPDPASNPERSTINSHNSNILADKGNRSENVQHRQKLIADEKDSQSNEKVRQSIRGGWRKIVMAGPGLGYAASSSMREKRRY